MRPSTSPKFAQPVNDLLLLPPAENGLAPGKCSYARKVWFAVSNGQTITHRLSESNAGVRGVRQNKIRRNETTILTWTSEGVRKSSCRAKAAGLERTRCPNQPKPASATIVFSTLFFCKANGRIIGVQLGTCTHASFSLYSSLAFPWRPTSSQGPTCPSRLGRGGDGGVGSAMRWRAGPEKLFLVGRCHITPPHKEGGGQGM